MPDLYLRIADQPDEVLDAVAAAMDKRAAEPAMQEICADYMAGLPRGTGHLLEVGCGNGATSALLRENLAPKAMTGVDPSYGLIARARQRFAGEDGVRFLPGDAVNTGQDGASCQAVVAHTVYSHLPDPAGALAEAYRVLEPGGVLAIFDGDYATNTVELYPGDPLQAAMAAVQRNLIHDPYVMRRLPALLSEAGFRLRKTRAHGYMQTEKPDYLLSLIARGVDAAASTGECGDDLATGFKSEAERRVKDGSFYGAILFVSMIAEKPKDASRAPAAR
ncbi:methyltransferase domain-containing protein [Limibaculum sp. M0105]|uniref:Methyltransferase domain-containing protein n=1 Tax=Thermohalobaculum xanthum TaxID=2753746 RepID=A0A8J7SEB2_9RHOB|nr:methyltransferase domain-containing protein [Thermohalobaculum xanthum]MBK0399391.1 methyltransferase domain-containing protein [Thermohalobaculum xanthum]